MKLSCLALCFVALGAAAQTNPVKVATLARFDLQGDAGTISLNTGYMTAGSATVDRQNWLSSPADQSNSYTVNFSVAHYSWASASFRFTPAGGGNVMLTIRGPWEQSPNGAIYKQEVLWDACSAAGAVLTNGSFEKAGGGLPLGWWRTYGTDAAVDAGPVPPVNGSNYVRVWHDGPLSCEIPVTGGVPVTLNFFARAAFPTNLIDMARIPGANTPAHAAARKFMRGANMGDYLEAPPGQDWGSHYTVNDFINARREGFDHVRIPAGWNYHAGAAPSFTIDPAFFGLADFMVTNALNQGLSAILNIHNWNEFATNATANTNEFYAIWTQIAAHYAAASSSLAFELMNEPNGAGSSTAILNPIYAEAIRRIRLTNPNRTIFAGPGQWNGISELGNLILPDSDSNIIVTVHCYDPFYFTHQGATWPGPDTATVGVVFPGPPAKPITPAAGIGSYVTNWFSDYNTLPAAANPSSPLAFAFEQQFARQWSDYYGRPVHIGEFGAYTMADPISRANFYTAFRSGAEALGIGWAMWDWNAGFHYWDPSTGQPAPGLRAAMFPAPSLTTSSPGQITFTSAISKTFRVDRNWRAATNGWTPIATNTLTTTNFNYVDPQAGASNAAFYRAFWMK